ncbi:ASCH domain-containing protein [Bremerella sp. T1]|uniref:ASCH domain-containing protein n=1 Tax=Bremerella sp. TYQ1 TaxID=3119568 RepID=UPI001CCDEC89|nr:ASCH domain-containing protein [Bremerella volcania]UBM33735.1 ASCH domain-containing protein [Bremerella volcania]
MKLSSKSTNVVSELASDDRLTLWLSIKPTFAGLITSGEKTVELRRTKPSASAGDIALIYASSPERSLVGAAVIACVLCLTPTELWPHVKDCAGVDRQQFDDYFEGASTAVGIWFEDVHVLQKPITLAKVRNKLPGFHPPQTYRYLTQRNIRSLGLSSCLNELTAF